MSVLSVEWFQQYWLKDQYFLPSSSIIDFLAF